MVRCGAFSSLVSGCSRGVADSCAGPAAWKEIVVTNGKMVGVSRDRVRRRRPTSCSVQSAHIFTMPKE